VSHQGKDARHPEEKRAMPHPGQPLDPCKHYTRLAWALVSRIQPLLRPDEVNDCARVFYEDIRTYLEQERQEKRA
jgi:hypothetical protein